MSHVPAARTLTSNLTLHLLARVCLIRRNIQRCLLLREALSWYWSLCGGTGAVHWCLTARRLAFPCGVYMFHSYTHGFSPCTPVFTHRPKTWILDSLGTLNCALVRVGEEMVVSVSPWPTADLSRVYRASHTVTAEERHQLPVTR